MRTSIWQNFRFTRFFISFSIGNLGDWFDVFALQIIFVHEFHASPIIMGVLALFYFIPGVVFGPFAGAFADRFSKRNIMMAVEIICGLLTAGLFFSANILTALLLLLIRSGICSISGPAEQAYIKQVVPTEQLLQATSYTSIVFQMCKVLGPILGAVILIYFPARSCLAINAVSFVLSAIILITLPRDKPVLLVEQQTKCNLLQDIKIGGRYIWQHRLIRNTFGIMIIWFTCSMIRMSQLAIFINHLLPNNTRALGYVIGLDGLGAVIAGTILSKKGDIRNYHFCFVAGFLLLGVGTLGIAIYQISWPLILFYLPPFVLGLGSGICMVVYGFFVKKESLEHQVGCVSGIGSALQNTALAFGTILGGLLIIQFGVREVYIGLSVAMFILATATIFLLKSKGILK
ncbi:MAG: MFS transporter [Gammaproteobacteria bacterium]|jgi:MFS family permease